MYRALSASLASLQIMVLLLAMAVVHNLLFSSRLILFIKVLFSALMNLVEGSAEHGTYPTVYTECGVNSCRITQALVEVQIRIAPFPPRSIGFASL